MRIHNIIIYSVLLVVAAFAFAQEKPHEGLSIEGTYTLVSRQLPDGATQNPPAIRGMLTYTKSYRNFNIIWKDSLGNYTSISSVSTYKLTDAEYTETNLFYIQTDQANDTINYETSGQTGSAPVTVKDGRIEFELPLFNEPSIVFEGNQVTASGPGFVDVWEKVE